MKLRGHHLLCLYGFRGLGYNQKFIKNMQHILDKIKANPQMGIKITDRPDDICAACPYNINNRCQQNTLLKPANIDRRVLKRLNFKTNVEIKAEIIFQLIKTVIKPVDIPSLCNCCPWLKYGYCQEGLAKKVLP